MNKREKEVLQSQIDTEKAVLKDIEKQYKQALQDIDDKIAQLMGRNDADLQNVIYQTQYQKQLRTQVQSILEQLQANEFETVSEFLASCYTEGFVGTMYSMHGQGVPLIIPIDQKAVVKAVTLDSKLKEDLYTSLGVDITKLKKTVSGEITRGIAAGQTYQQIARSISNQTKAPLNRVTNIVQTESHRIRQAASYDAANEAKSKGADVVKQWDSTLDGDTRPTHRKLDGQIRELDEPFEMDGKNAMYPGDFGDPAEDCRCRCVMLQRARWALGEDELNTLKDRAKFFGLDKSAELKDFEKKYIKAAETLENTTKSGIMEAYKSATANTLKLPDIQIGKSVGAKAKNYEVMDLATGEMFHFVEGTSLKDVEVFAGKGLKKVYENAHKYANKFGGKVEDWQHAKGKGWLDTPDGERFAEVHWSQCDGIGKHDFFVKRWLDE